MPAALRPDIAGNTSGDHINTKRPQDHDPDPGVAAHFSDTCNARVRGRVECSHQLVPPVCSKASSNPPR
jgi:hypothetical protein